MQFFSKLTVRQGAAIYSHHRLLQTQNHWNPEEDDTSFDSGSKTYCP
jgi:hypothetical protein